MSRALQIKDFPNYYVTDAGDVYSRNYRGTGRIKKIAKNKTKLGYLYVTIHNNCVGKKKLIHRLVATAFIPNPENKLEVNHKNGDKTDNRVENLEWVTRKENHIHCRDNLSPRYCKINSEIASLIRSEKGLSHREIGLKYGLKHTQVGYILQNKRWAI